jgi:glutathione S-transferase
MALDFYYGSGSPYAWRVWLALEHKGAPYTLRPLSFDAGDLRSEAFTRLNPRQRVPVLVEDGFSLYESAAIVEYLEDRWPGGAPLFSPDPRQRAVQRRMIREADQYFAEPLEELVQAVLYTPPDRRSPERIAHACARLRDELAFWDPRIGADFLAGSLSAADFTLYPQVALAVRIGARNPGVVPADLVPAQVGAWMERMEALPVVQRTWPAHWRAR